MSIIKWTQDLQIGIKEIDEQHQYLINLINELQLAVEYHKGEEVILSMIDKLHSYAQTHFTEEELLLDTHDFPGKVDHALEHDEFIAKLDELKSEYQSNAEVLTIHIRNFILGWFFNHIRLNDMEYKRYLEQKQVIAPQ
jgi:hemerythrin